MFGLQRLHLTQCLTKIPNSSCCRWRETLICKSLQCLQYPQVRILQEFTPTKSSKFSVSPKNNTPKNTKNLTSQPTPKSTHPQNQPTPQPSPLTSSFPHLSMKRLELRSCCFHLGAMPEDLRLGSRLGFAQTRSHLGLRHLRFQYVLNRFTKKNKFVFIMLIYDCFYYLFMYN